METKKRVFNYGIFVMLILLTIAGALIVDWFASETGMRARWEAERAQAKTEELQARRELLATWPLVFASMKDSILVFLLVIVDNVLLIILVIRILNGPQQPPQEYM